MSRRASGNFAVVCLSFISEMKSNKDTRYKQINCRPDYILEKIDIPCRFWKLRCFVIGTWPKCLNWRGESNNAPEGQDKSSSFTADKMVLKVNVFWPNHLLEDWFVSRRTSHDLSSQKGQIPLTLRSQKFISYVAQSFESTFWKLRDCFLTWNAFFCSKSCIGCYFRPLKFDKILLA